MYCLGNLLWNVSHSQYQSHFDSDTCPTLGAKPSALLVFTVRQLTINMGSLTEVSSCERYSWCPLSTEHRFYSGGLSPTLAYPQGLDHDWTEHVKNTYLIPFDGELHWSSVTDALGNLLGGFWKRECASWKKMDDCKRGTCWCYSFPFFQSHLEAMREQWQEWKIQSGCWGMWWMAWAVPGNACFALFTETDCII